MPVEEEESFSSAGDWDITTQAFIPKDLPRGKISRAWDRVPVVAQAQRLQGNTVWKKAVMRKNGTSNEAGAESAANEEGPRKRLKGAGFRVSIQDATWAPIPPDSLLQCDDLINLERDASQDTTTKFEEIKGTFPNFHYVPRKRTHTNQIITPREVKCSAEMDLTEEAKRLLAPEVVSGSEKPTRRRKSARISMANRRVTLGGPDLGLNTPLRGTPLRASTPLRISTPPRAVTPSGAGTPSRGTPAIKIFESGGGPSSDTKRVEFGAHTLARSTRRSSGSATELASPSTPLRRSLRTSTGGNQTSPSPLSETISAPETKASTDNIPTIFEGDETQETKKPEAEVQNPFAATAAGALVPNEALAPPTNVEIQIKSPKRKRKSSPKPSTRKSSRLSLLNRTPLAKAMSVREAYSSVLRGTQAQPVLPVTSDTSSEEGKENASTLTEDVSKPKGQLTEAPDIFKSTQTSREEKASVQDCEQSPTNNIRSPTRRSIHDLVEEPRNSTSKTDILISIKSIYMDSIRSGEKTHEFRAYKLPEETQYLWLYETAPKQCISYVAKIGPAKVPGEIDDKGLDNTWFNSRKDKSHYAYEILHLYELAEELPLQTLLEKGYTKGPPQKYSFASQQMLNDKSLDNANLIRDANSERPASPTKEAISVPQIPGTSEPIALFSSEQDAGEEIRSSLETESVNSVPDESLPSMPEQLDSIEEEAVSVDQKEIDSYSLREQMTPSRLRSLSPEFEDLLSLENTPRLLSPRKEEEHRLSRLSPLQFGNYLLEELDDEEKDVLSPASPDMLGDMGFSLPSSASTDDAAMNTSDVLNPALSLAPHDDTTMLEDFVTRVKASRAANLQDASKSISAPSTIQSPARNPLAYVDSNLSPKLSSLKSRRHVTTVVGTPPPQKSSLEADKLKRPATPLAISDEKEAPIRRSGRSRTSVKGAASSSLPVPITAPSSIPMRPHTAFAIQQRAEDKKLATVTRTNTTKNNGQHSRTEFLRMQRAGRDVDAELNVNYANGTPSVRTRNGKKKMFSAPKAAVETKKIEEAVVEEPVVEEPVAAPKPKSSKGKTVMWAEDLVQYQEAPATEEKTAIAEVKNVKVGVRSATASKIAFGMGISGPSASTLIPDLALATASSATSSSAATTGTNGSSAPHSGIPVMKKGKTPQKPTKIASAAKGTTTVKSKSKIALGMAGNGTPAPKKLRKPKA